MPIRINQQRIPRKLIRNILQSRRPMELQRIIIHQQRIILRHQLRPLRLQVKQLLESKNTQQAKSNVKSRERKKRSKEKKNNEQKGMQRNRHLTQQKEQLQQQLAVLHRNLKRNPKKSRKRKRKRNKPTRTEMNRSINEIRKTNCWRLETPTEEYLIQLSTMRIWRKSCKSSVNSLKSTKYSEGRWIDNMNQNQIRLTGISSFKKL